MKIKEEQINLDNIEAIMDRELRSLNHNINTDGLFVAVRKWVYDIFNTTNNNKETELKELECSIDIIRDFLVEIMYGKHELE